MRSAVKPRASRVQAVYAALCVLGAVLPLAWFVPWLLDHGPDATLFLDELFANRVSSFFATDLLVSAVVLLAWLFLDRRALPARQRLAVIAGTCLVGVSFGLPLYLLLRERHHAS